MFYVFLFQFPWFKWQSDSRCCSHSSDGCQSAIQLFVRSIVVIECHTKLSFSFFFCFEVYKTFKHFCHDELRRFYFWMDFYFRHSRDYLGCLSYCLFGVDTTRIYSGLPFKKFWDNRKIQRWAKCEPSVTRNHVASAVIG